MLHRFFQKHADKVGKVLLSLSRMTNSHDAAAASGKRTWDYFCNLLMELGVALEPPTLTDKPSNKHQAFERFMAKNRHRNMDPVREIFQNTTSLKVRPSCYHNAMCLTVFLREGSTSVVRSRSFQAKCRDSRP